MYAGDAQMPEFVSSGTPLVHDKGRSRTANERPRPIGHLTAALPALLADVVRGKVLSLTLLSRFQAGLKLANRSTFLGRKSSCQTNRQVYMFRQ